MNHSFDIEIASKYGILEAILLQDIYFWVKRNKENNINFHEGKYWTYNSIRAFSEMYPYASQKQIRTALNHLRKEGFLETGSFGENKFNHSLWYTITPEGLRVLAFAHKGESICDQEETTICPQGQQTDDFVCPDGEPDVPTGASDLYSNEIYIYSSTNSNNTNSNNITDTNYISETPYNPPQGEADTVVQLYNEICYSMPKVRETTDDRRKKIKSLLKKYTVGDIETVFIMAQESDFLSGRSGKWDNCGFDWLIKPSNFVKVLEGNYKNKKTITKSEEWDKVL